jgi:hypothetical protein
MKRTIKFLKLASGMVLFSFLAKRARSGRSVKVLEDGWKFKRGPVKEGWVVDLGETQWDKVSVPHDWAITGSFDRDNDLQVIRIIQDEEKSASAKTGRTGALPHLNWEGRDVEDLVFVTVSVVDEDGNPCPTASNQLDFEVKGEGTYRAACNGDPTSMELFHLPTMKLFSGKLVVLVQPTTAPGPIELLVSGEGLLPATIGLRSLAQ